MNKTREERNVRDGMRKRGSKEKKKEQGVMDGGRRKENKKKWGKETKEEE